MNSQLSVPQFRFTALLRVFIFLTFVFALLASALSFGNPESCKKSVELNGALPTTERTYWYNQLDQAQEQKNLMGTLYIVLRLGQLEPHRYALKSKERAWLNRAIHLLEISSFQQDYEQQASAKKRLKATLNFLGLSHGFQKKIFGITPYKQSSYKFRGVPYLIKDLSHTLLPPLFSLFLRPGQLDPLYSQYPIIFRILDHYKTTHLQIPIRTKLAFDFEILANKLIETENQVENIRHWTLGRKLVPFIWSLGILTATGLTPNEWFIEKAPSYGYESYHDTQYIHDVNQHQGNLNQGKLLIVYSESLFPTVDSREKAPLAFSSVTSIENKDFTLLKIKQMQDLATFDYSQFDNIIIFSHGTSDSLQLGLDSTNLKKMKKGANLVLLSCLVGQKGGGVDNERWIQFSKALLNGGTAVASTQALSTDLTPENAGPIIDTTAPIQNSYLSNGLKFILQTSGIYILIKKSIENDFGLKNEFYLKPKGIRVYDSTKNTVEYFPSEDPDLQNEP